MKALTLWQPWASMCVLRGNNGTILKEHETRSWGTTYRGPLAIHAAKRPVDPYEIVGVDAILAENGINYSKLPLGAIVGMVEMVDCIRMTAELIESISKQERTAGRWEVGRYAWRFRGACALKKPIPWPGHQGFWDLDMEEKHFNPPYSELVDPGEFRLKPPFSRLVES